MDATLDVHADRMAAVIDTLTTTRTLADLDPRDWLVFRHIARRCTSVPIADVAEGEPDLYDKWLSAQVRWRDLGLGHMTLARVEQEMAARGLRTP